MRPLGRGRCAFGLTVLACAWGIAFIAAAFLVPVYSSETASPSGASTASASSTLVQVNGLSVLIPAAMPALVAALVWFSLHRKCTRGGAASGIFAWSLIGTLWALGLLAIASIGLFIVPEAGLLAGAASLTPSGTQPGVSVNGADV